MTLVAYEVDDWGVAELWLDGRRVVWHELPRARTAGPAPVGGSASPPTSTLARRSARKRDGFAPTLVARLCGYFHGEPEDFGDVELDLGELSPFGRDLALALRRVPRGEVVTYGELAALAGRPSAGRAAGTFCARNRQPIFVPCHRVVAAGGIGGYGDLGVAYKRRLLELENVAL